MTEAYIRENASASLLKSLEGFVASRPSRSSATPSAAEPSQAHRGPAVASRNKAGVGMLNATVREMGRKRR